MIKVIEHSDGAYVMEIDTPERIAIAAIAVGYSIPKEDAIAAIMNRGMDSIGKQLKDEAAKVELKRLSQEDH